VHPKVKHHSQGTRYGRVHQLLLSSIISQVNNLDAFWEEVSSLGVVLRSGQCGTELVNDGYARGSILGPESKDADHGETAVLQLVELVRSILFLRVVEAERVVTARSLSDTKVSSLVVGSLLSDDSNTTELEGGHEEGDLKKGSTRGTGKGLNRVGVGVGIETSPLVSWKGSEKARGDETDNSDLGDTAVDELGLTVPGKAIDLTIGGIEPRSSGDSGETKRVKTSISHHGSIKGWRRLGERKSGRRAPFTASE
jgi:hypothetical protein